MAVHYLEIVSNDVDTLTGLYQRMHGLSFGPPDPDLGQARVATRADGTLVGIRKPLAAHEQPIMRSYLAVEDIQQAVKKAHDSGATIASPPTRQGQWGTSTGGRSRLSVTSPPRQRLHDDGGTADVHAPAAGRHDHAVPERHRSDVRGGRHDVPGRPCCDVLHALHRCDARGDSTWTGPVGGTWLSVPSDTPAFPDGRGTMTGSISIPPYLSEWSFSR